MGSLVGSVSGSEPSTVSGFVIVVPFASVPASDTSLTEVFPGVVPVTFAVFVTLPASKSAWVNVCTAVKFAVTPGARLVIGFVPLNVALASVTVTFVKVVPPVFVTTNL